ncbi:response regulator [Microbacterium maritypicum]|uniref:response regulator n=1 Tax=Microbacterium maritypicum TaxID=33918 RepID=UPI0022E23AD2|nr:response regulator [Microbacterium liquefaciens]
MYVSVEVITMLATAVTLLVAIISGFGWMINRMDARFAEVVATFNARFETQDAKFDARFEAQDAKLDARFDRIEQEIVEVKIAIARLEGPTPRLIAAR